eukprot:7469930-Pyramimonas_sp.AAC.1
MGGRTHMHALSREWLCVGLPIGHNQREGCADMGGGMHVNALAGDGRRWNSPRATVRVRVVPNWARGRHANAPTGAG